MARALRALHAPIIAVLILILIFEAAITPTTVRSVDPTPTPAPSEAVSPPPADETGEPAAPETEVEPASEAAEGPVEVIDERTIDSRTFENPDGTFTTEYHTTPIHYEDADGELQPIEAVPVASRTDGVAFETKSAAVHTELGAASATGDLVTVSTEDHRVSFRPTLPPLAVGAAPAADRAPVIEDGSVLYGDVYPDVDLRYVLLPTGVKEDIILKAPGTPHRFAFTVDAPGLTAELQRDGSIELRDKDAVVFHIPAPFMVDSATDGDGDGVRSTAVTYELLSVGATTVLVVDADPAWLADPARVYPVYLDPTIQNYGTTADTFISSAYPNNSFNTQWNPADGGYYELWNGMWDATSGKNWAYVKTSIPIGANVTDATFNIYVQHAASGGTGTQFNIARLNSAFTTGQTWNMTHPTFTHLTQLNIGDNSWASFNVTSTVQAWVLGSAPNHGVRLSPGNSNNTSHWKRLRASESTSGPYLRVTYTGPDVTPTSPVGNAWGGNRMSWLYSQNGTGLPQAQFGVDISDSPTDYTGSHLKATTNGAVSSANQYWDAPTTNLVSGGTYYWRVTVSNGYRWSGWSASQQFRYDGTPPIFIGTAVEGAATAADPNFYEAADGTLTVKLRAADGATGVRLSYLRLYNAVDELRVYHDWTAAANHCGVFDTSSLVNVSACARTFDSGGQREVMFTVVGLNADTAFDVQYYFADHAGNVVGYGDTGINLIFDAIAPTGSLSAPAAGASVDGTVPITGTASDANFTQYTVHYGVGASPSSWVDIGTNPRTTAVSGGTLATWNTAGLASGTHTIRLQVFDKARVSAGFTTLTRTVTVNNDAPVAIVSAPIGDRLVDGQLQVRGTASAPAAFADYTLHYGIGCSPLSWIDIGVNPRTTPITNGLLGTWDTAGLAGEHTIRLVARRSDGPTTTATVCVRLGTSLGRQSQHTLETWDLGAGDELAVNVATGNAVFSHPLVDLPYRGGSLPIGLTYNSLSTDNVGLGVGWQLNLQRRLVLNTNNTVTFVDVDGARHLFTAPQTVGSVTTYTRPDSLYATLVRDTAQLDEFTLTYRDQMRDRFDITGALARLTAQIDRHGNTVSVTYAVGLEIDAVSDPSGRSVDLAWSPAGNLLSITDWAWIDAAGVVQASGTGTQRMHRFFHDGGQLAGWSAPFNTTGSCPAGGSHVTCLAYTDGLLTGVAKTQTVTTFSAGVLGTTTRAITTQVAHADARVAQVTDAEQVAQPSPARTTFTWTDADSVTVARPTTTTGYELLTDDDSFARVRSVLRYLDPSTPIERRTSWDTAFPVEPASVTDNFGAILGTPARTVSYTYQAGSLGLLEKVTEPLTASTNRWTEHTYNTDNDVTQTVVSQDGSGSLRTATRFCYDTGCTLSGTGPDLLAEIDNYVAGGASNNDTNVRSDHSYDSDGQRISSTRHNRDSTGAVLDDRVDAFAYDTHGNLISEITNYADGAVITPGDDVTPNFSTQARTDLTTTHLYDTAGNRISTADPRRAIDAALGTSLGSNDFVTRWTHDAANRRLTETTPTTPGHISTKTSTTTHDELGSVRSASDLAGLVTAAGFDRSGRAVASYEDPVDSPVATAPFQTGATVVDADGRQLSVKDRRQLADASLGATTYGYDGVGRNAEMTEAAGAAGGAEASSTTGYDALDRRTSYVVAGQETTYAYDLGGRVTATDDGFTCTTGTYDFRDLPTQTVKGKAGNGCAGTGDTPIAHTHDGLGRRTRDEQGSLRPLDDTFDAVGNRRRSAPVTDDGGSPLTTVVDLVVNPLDQVVAETRTEDTTARTSKTTYDAAGNATGRCRWETSGAGVGACLPVGTTPWSNPPAHVTTSTYDALNQRVALIDASTHQTTVYDPLHNYQPQAVYSPLSAGSELQTTYAYDGQHRLVTVATRTCTISTGHDCATTTPLGSSTYTYDSNNNRTSVAESHDGGAATVLNYCYDARNQLAARNTAAPCTPTSGDETYTYDDAGNRLSATQNGTTRTFGYTIDGQATDASYDAAGRVSSWDYWHFLGYDAEGRLTNVCDIVCSWGSLKLFFRYDADGRRTEIAEAGGGSTTVTELRYTDGRISAEYVKNCDVNECGPSVLSREYVTDESGAIVKMTIPVGQPNAGTYSVSWNGHGDALNLLHVSGGTVTLANSFSYDTWGASTVHTHNGIPDLGFRFRYAGQFGVQDDSVHDFPLLLMGARHYAPEAGRFIQPDPAAEESNLYGYTANNPVTRVDPDGKFWWVVVVVVVRVAVKVVPRIIQAVTRAAPKVVPRAATRPRPVAAPKMPPVPTRPTISPGRGWEWRGPGPVGTGKGSWYNPRTGEVLRPDLGHRPPVGPHWDYKDAAGNWWRISNGRMTPKK